ncbi:MAG TPA: VTT domain-containing protein [Thermodesulfobacteriota bacterium]|nr:VTT domain-containing protein [Thermodesulfobacteriota bacterium]
MKTSYALKGIFLASFVILGTYLFIHFELNLFLVDQNKLIKFINSFHPYDDFVFIVFQIFQVLIVGAIPGEISEFIGGYIYGPVLGTIYSAIGLCIGSWFAFGLARVYGLPFVKRIVKPSIMGKYDYLMEHQGRHISFILFMVPGFPKAALCYIIGLSHMSLWTFIAVSTPGRLLGIILVSVCGSSIKNHQGMIFFALLAVMAIMLLLAYLFRDRLMKLGGKRKSMDVEREEE